MLAAKTSATGQLMAVKQDCLSAVISNVLLSTVGLPPCWQRLLEKGIAIIAQIAWQSNWPLHQNPNI